MRLSDDSWGRRKIALAFGLAILGTMVLSCSEEVIAIPVPISFGEACRAGDTCAGQLECIDATCQPTGGAVENDPCVVSADCGTGLACSSGQCVAAGTGVLGAPCSSTPDCTQGLRCSATAGVASCVEAGTAFAGERCASSDDCLAGLVCDGATTACATEFSPPFGVPCVSETDCAPEQGIVCLEGGRCGGLGPDGEPVSPWTGIDCPAFSSLDGDFRVYFDRTAGDFFRMPFPNDARRTADGVDLEGYPTPPAGTVGNTFVSGVIGAAQSDPLGFANGFGPHQTVFMRFSGPPVFCGSGCGEDENEVEIPDVEAGCMGAAEPEPTVFVVDLTKNNSGDFFGFSTGLAFFWRASTASQPYICGPWIGVRPEFNSTAPTLSDTWKPGHTYAVFVHSRVRGCDGETRVESMRSSSVNELLMETAPVDPIAAADWQAYAPLREWLGTSPTYPTGGTVSGDDFLGLSVFTVRDPSAVGQSLADQVLTSMTQPSVEQVTNCTIDPAPEDCSTDPLFTEVRGTLVLPNYQEGTAPYLETGGSIASENGQPAVQGTVTVRFAASVPATAAPVGGWPVVIYAHGTGGSELSHIQNGTAGLLSSIAAMIGIEQVGHGSRRGDSTVDPEFLVFNVQNPRGTRGNQLQALVDQVALSTAVDELSTAIAASLSVSGTLFDSSRIAWLGHSQGGNAVALAAPSVPTTTVSVLSGTGGVLLETLNGKTEPYDAKSLLRAALLDPTLNDTFFHPVLDLLQGYYEEGDPSNYAPRFARELPDTFEAKHVLHLIGVGDTFTPNGAGMALARGLGGAYADTVNSGLPERSETVASVYPVTNTEAMRTVVTSLHVPAAGSDGHFVLFEADGLAATRVIQFLSSWAAGTEPAVVEQ